jgi:hypothetical protein
MAEQSRAKMAHDIFISHSSKDKLPADAACATLEKNGIRCWIAPRDVVVGMDYSDQLTQAIEDCRAIVIIFSSHSNGSHQVKAEIDSAFATNKILIPLRIEDIEPTKGMAHYLRTVHWLDAYTMPFEQHLQRLSETILRLLPDRIPFSKAAAMAATPAVMAAPVIVGEPPRMPPTPPELSRPASSPATAPNLPAWSAEAPVRQNTGNQSAPWPLWLKLTLIIGPVLFLGAAIFVGLVILGSRDDKPTPPDPDLTSALTQIPNIPPTEPTAITDTPPPAATPDARANLSTAVAEAIRLLDAKDYASLIEEFASPEDLKDLLKGITLEDFAKSMQQDPDVAKTMAGLLDNLHAVQGQQPVFTDDGNTATYLAIKSDGTNQHIVFKREEGLWYLNDDGADADQPAPKPADTDARASLDTAAAEAIRLAKAADVAGLLKEFASPEDMKDLPPGTTIDDIIQVVQQKPDLTKQMSDFMTTLTSLDGLQPTLSDDGITATYEVTTADGSKKDVVFKKIDGLWYIKDM